jgi:hypothetical protein
MKDKVEKGTLRIHSVEDLYEAIQHFARMYGIEESKLTFPDGLPLVSLTYVRRTFKDGTRTSELILSDQ